MISLLILLCGLFCTSSAMCYTSRHLTGVDQLRAQELANRQRTATPTTSSPTASKVVVINPQSEVGAIAPATTPAGRPPLPTIPPKSVDFTADQARYYDAFINLAPLLKDPKRFAKGADGVRNIIDGAIVGTNPCKIIAQRAELQQTVLAVIFAGLSKKALEQAALPADKLHDALDAGTKLHTVLNYEAWETMNIDANSALKPQSLNALDRLDDFRDQPVSPANAVTYHDFTAAATAAKHLNALEIAGGSEGMTPFFTSLMDNVQKMEDAHLADKSGEAQEAFLAAGKLQPPEQLNEADKKKLLNFAQNLREVAHRTMPLARRKIADEEATRITNDVLGKETPIDEMRDFARDLANALYQPGTNLASPDGPKKFKASFFAQPNNLKRLCTYLLRINTILTQAVTAQTSPLASPKAEKYLLPILWLPAEFFETIKTQLNANALTATDRDNFIVVMTGLLATFKHNALVFGIKSAYGSNSVESLAAATSQLTLASSQENETYRNIVDYTRAIKATLMEIIEKNSLPAATFLAPVDDAGKTLTYEAAVAKNKEILGEAKTPKEAYGKLINCLNKTLSSNKDIIITNEKIFTALLSQDSSLEPEDISVKVQKVLKPADVMATNMFFILQKGIRTQVATTAHKIFPTVAESIVQQEILGPCYEFLYDVYESMPGNPPILKDPATLKKDLFSSSDSIKQMVQRLTVFSNVVTQKGRPDIADALTNSAIVRYSLYIPPFLALSADFFAQARTISDDKTRYNISRYGYALIDTLLTLENGNETTTPALSTLRELFKSVGNTDKESALLATFQKNIAQINDAVKKIDTATGTEQQKMISAYTAGFKQIMTLIKDGDSRTFIGFNYAAHSLIFSDNGLFLTAVPAGLNSDGRQATSEFLHAVLDNPNDLNYADRPDRQQIETSMRDMIATLEKSDREAAHALPKEASDLSSLLNAAYINLKDMKTYQDGLMCIYSQMKNADTRKIVGKYKEIYNALFATTGVFCIPTGIDVGKLDPTQIDPITIQVGLSLFQCLQENPNELGWDGDNLARSLIFKMTDFFKNLNKAATATPDAAATGTAAKEVVEKKSTTLQNQAASDTAALTATQLTNFITQYHDDLRDKKKIGAFCESIYKQLDSESERIAVSKNPELKKLIFSEGGILLSATELPQTYIPPLGLKQALQLYNLVKDNPKDFGIVSASASIDPITKGVAEILVVLNKLKAIMDDPSQNYEDTESYEYIAPDATTGQSKGYGNLALKILTGNTDPVKAIGPQITEVSLRDNGWSTQQIEIYAFIYKSGYADVRSNYTAVFAPAINTIKTMCTKLDQNNNFIKAGAMAKFFAMRRLLNKRPLADAFHAAFLDLPYLPGDIANKEWESKRKEALAFYSYLNQDSLLNTNRRKFEITAQYVGQLQNIIGWLQKPETAPNRIQGAVDDGSLLQGSSMMMGAGIPMMGAGIPMMGAGVPMMGGMQGMGMPGMMGSMGMMGSSGNIGTLLSAAGSTSAANMALTQASARTLNGYGGMMGGYGYSAMGMQGGYGYSAMGMPMYPQMYGQQATPSASLPTVTQADVKAAAIEAARAQSQEDRLAAMQRDLDRERTERELDALRASRQNSQQSNPVATSVTVTSTKDSSSDDSVRTTPSRLEAAPDATLKGTADTTIDDPNSITDDQRRINGYIKFFKEQSKYLKDPARIGAFCDAAYEILSGAGKRSALGQKVWNTLTPEIINGLTITDRTRIREDMELHSVIFSKDGLLPDITKDDGTLIEPGIAVDILPLALKSALKLYKYIIDHESDLNITGDSTSQAKHIYNLFKHQQTDAIYFEKMSTVSLTDPNKLETFCLKALRILKRSKKTTMVWQKIKNTATLSSNDTDRTRFQEDVRLQKAIFSSNGLLIDLTLLKKLRYTAKGLDAAINLYQYILQNPSALGIDGDDVIQQQVTDLLNFFKQSQTTYKTSSPSIRASSTSRSVRTITVPLLETFTRPRKMVEAV